MKQLGREIKQVYKQIIMVKDRELVTINTINWNTLYMKSLQIISATWQILRKLKSYPKNYPEKKNQVYPDAPVTSCTYGLNKPYNAHHLLYF